jgi:hypothetical protein
MPRTSAPGALGGANKVHDEPIKRRHAAWANRRWRRGPLRHARVQAEQRFSGGPRHDDRPGQTNRRRALTSSWPSVYGCAGINGGAGSGIGHGQIMRRWGPRLHNGVRDAPADEGHSRQPCRYGERAGQRGQIFDQPWFRRFQAGYLAGGAMAQAAAFRAASKLGGTRTGGRGTPAAGTTDARLSTDTPSPLDTHAVGRGGF